MPLGPLPICQCPIYLNGTQNGADLNPYSHRFFSDCPHEKFAKKVRCLLCGQSCHSFSQSSRFGHDTKKQELYLSGNDILVLPEENASYIDSFPSCQPGSEDSALSDDASSQVNPQRYQAVQELLKQFSGNKQDHPHEVSSGYFKEEVVIKFRRALYFSGLRVLYVKGGGFHRHISADYFLRNPKCLQRLIPWLKRELIAIFGDYGYTAKNILTIILQNMTEYDLDSQTFSEILGPYLLQYNEHFLHEFISFARSPFSMKTYDQRAIYECPSPSNGRGNLFTISPTNNKWALPALENYSEMAKTIHDSWNKGALPHSSSKHNMTSDSSSISPEGNLEDLDRTRNKHHLRTPTMSESGDSKDVTSSQSCTHIAHLKSLGEDSIRLLEPPSDSKKYTSEGNTEERKLQLEQDKCLGDNKANYSVSDISSASNSSPREKKLLALSQPMKTQEKESEKNKNPDSLDKIFQRSPPMMKETQPPLSGNSSQMKDQTWSCNSEKVYSHRRPIQKGQRNQAFRKETLKCQLSCQDGELSSHPYRRLKGTQIRDYKNCFKQRLPQSSEDKSCSSHRPKKRRSRSRDHSDRGLRRSYTSEPLLTICCEVQEDDKGDYLSLRRVVLANPREFISARGTDQNLCNREKAFRVKSPSICLHPETHRPNCQCMRRSGTVRVGSISSHHEKMGKKRRFKCQCSEKENNKTIPNSLPAPVKMHQIQQSTSCYRMGLPKQFFNRISQAFKDAMGCIKKIHEKCDQKVEGKDYFGSRIYENKPFLERERINQQSKND
ncbi:E3 ubiquitin-protein ligase Topors-like [Trichosurus vulpecula]|uniref:E3 ubiquitin-protein ligase Topors-like n=1 Tax=Trichosurus vulpecula TaxID=9337 RepID=UPI00186B34C6|nr:E3 ubiquitin-protein ligase Topors-like [Trichosurus vulpecula]XP_036593551.1 E3 ubiquitin-protein ligase Topors-like [Trichosurus vulpecula]